MNVYLATKFENVKGFNAARKLLEAAGHTIACDWTVHDAKNCPEEALPGYLTQCALECSRGVCEADAVILLVQPKIAGALVEFGLAIGLSKQVIIVGAFDKGNQSNIFYHFRQVRGLYEHVDSIEEAIALLEPVIQVPADPQAN